MKMSTKRLGAAWCIVLASGAALACSQETAEVTEQPTVLEGPVIGGNAALLGEWPWQAQITNGGSPWCGGSLLSDEWILTAAHCVDGVSAGSLTVRVGLINRTVPGPQVQTRSVLSYQIHPDWDAAALENDVALIRLSSPVTFDQYVQPIDIAEAPATVGSTAYVTGWGWTVGGGSASNLLMEAALPVVDTATCEAAGTLSLPVTDAMLCAGYVAGTKGGCHGDSGGPLVVPGNGFSNGWKQIGVVSWGVGYSCSSYTVFARLSELAGWVNGVVGDPPVRGDVTGDGCVDDADHAAVIADFGDSVPPGNPAADLNADGIINIHDRLLVLENFGEGC